MLNAGLFTGDETGTVGSDGKIYCQDEGNHFQPAGGTFTVKFR